MKAAYYQARRELDVREAPDPEVGPNEVLLDLRLCRVEHDYGYTTVDQKFEGAVG